MPLDGDQGRPSTRVTWSSRLTRLTRLADLQPMRTGGMRGAGAGRGRDGGRARAMAMRSSVSWRANNQLCYGVCYGTEGLRDCRKGGTVGTRHPFCSALLHSFGVQVEGVEGQKRKGWTTNNNLITSF